MEHYDVIIMGSGIAGGFLARQLKLTRPSLNILVLEASQKMSDFKVGESTVEVAANYMIRKLNLGTYLYQHQLPKNGLRFFFDTGDKSLPLTKMSEIGSDHMPFHPSFQLERAKLERDLVTMNQELGVSILLGAKVTSLSIDGENSHTVHYEIGGQSHEAKARWLCDASGRRHLIQRTLGNKVHKETRLNTAAVWGRYWNVKGLDAETDSAFRSRVRYTSRHLSTNHMMYDGYWIWFIPLAGDLMSVGAVYDKDILTNGPRTREDFETFLDSHRSSRDLMRGAVFEDFQGYAHLPYHSDLFFSKDRWALTGEAGAFVDPFYSPGSDFIATANEFITSLILAEMDHGKDEGFNERIGLYNDYYKFKYESTLRLYIKLYRIFGCYEVYRLKYLLDFNNYYNLVVWPFMADKLTNPEWLREELKFTDLVLRAQSNMADHFIRLGEKLRASGEYFSQNEGRFSNGLCGVSQFETRLGPALDHDFRRAQVDKVYGSVFGALMERMVDSPGLTDRAPVLSELKLPQVVVFKEIDNSSVTRFMERVSAKMLSDLKKEFPGTDLRKIELSPGTANSGPALFFDGPSDTGQAQQISARARELWQTPANSLAQIRL